VNSQCGTKNKLTQATYKPFLNGYNVKPGFKPISHDFGNGAIDHNVFQIDENFKAYREAKMDARFRFCVHRKKFYPWYTVYHDIECFIREQLCKEYPQYFHTQEKNDEMFFSCDLTEEKLRFRIPHPWLIPVLTKYTEKYFSPIDILACQIQEDFAVIATSDHGNSIDGMHVCLPSGWDPAEKIGKSYSEIHNIVPGMEPVLEQEDKYVKLMVNTKEPLVRFVWGVSFDNALSRHPDLHSFEDFDVNNPTAFLRVERQVVVGFPDLSFALFVIRLYMYNMEEICQDSESHKALILAIGEMSDVSILYKLGSLKNRDNLLKWMEKI